MRPAQKVAIKVSFAALAVAAFSWLLVRTIRNSAPYSVDGAALSGWTLVAGEPGEPALVALQPPSRLTVELFRQVRERTRRSLLSPARPSVPLVLQSEYADSLQGVWSVDDIMNAARDAGVEAARFEPVCMAQRSESTPDRSGQLFFVVFDAQVFYQFRQQLSPLFPEHGGNSTYDPSALRPVLTIAATDREFVHRWPVAVEQRTDCLAFLRID